EIYTNYRTYARILKWLALTLLAYPITAFIVHQDWGTVFKSSVIPHIEFSFAFLFIITGVLGTTISPYMFFWEASQEVEEQKESNHKMGDRGMVDKVLINRMRIDNNSGMLVSEITTWCIILVGAAVLHQSGVR